VISARIEATSPAIDAPHVRPYLSRLGDFCLAIVRSVSALLALTAPLCCGKIRARFHVAGKRLPGSNIVDAARKTWPEVDAWLEPFRLFALKHKAEPAFAPDLFLAFAAGQGESAAIARVDAIIRAEAGPASKRAGRATDSGEVEQVVRLRLLVHQGEQPPRILTYAGRGPLQKWLRAAAVRVALDLAGTRRVEGDSAVKRLAAEGAGIVSEVVRSRYRPEFDAAIAEALASLSSVERNVLRLHHLEEVSLERLAVMYNVHRATVARWLANARDRVLLAARDRLRQRLRLKRSEFDSLFRAVEDELHVSVRRHLETKR
jgi:RNA polymerase sigma-70 factor, ECF subfamily